MRELEFLPKWYPRLRHRKRLIVMQSWLTIACLASLALWGVVAQHKVRVAEAKLSTLHTDLQRTGEDLNKLEELLQLEQKWRQKDLIRAKLGGHIEAAKLIEKVEEMLPPEMGVLELEMNIDDTLRPPPPGLAATALAKDQPVDRRLKVRLRGVAPTDVDLATFLARISGVPYFEHIGMTYARDRIDAGHVMREFEVSWSISLVGW